MGSDEWDGVEEEVGRREVQKSDGGSFDDSSIF